MQDKLQGKSTVGHDKRKSRFEYLIWPLFLVVVGLLLVVGYLVSLQKLYKPGSELGYNMGLVGGLMMLTLLLYPLRKRAAFMKPMGGLRHWFKLHMAFGILGPVLVLFHSTFHIGSINAGVALVCMLVVAGSGIIGRFAYTKIHRGLYGRSLTLQELQADMEKSGNVKSVFGFVPGIEQKLEAFRTYALGHSGGAMQRVWHFLTLGVRVRVLARALAKELRHAMYRQAREEKWGGEKLRGMGKLYHEYKDLIEEYLRAVQSVAQFHIYERIFSWWHIMHIPLVYMLVFSAIFHVIAVHMY
ncbi:MAG: hypothetical protein ACOY3V_03065 [Pseudomonadota bacterium]